MEKPLFNLQQPQYSYLIGFIQTDGHLQSNTRNRGRLSIEISYKDKEILMKLQNIIPVNTTIYTRVRNTNFIKNHTGITLNVFDKNFRETINYYGVPYGKKSNIIEPPKVNYSQIDYWRGIIDGDGSLGMTSNNIPFISLITMSEKLFLEYKKFLTNFGIEINLNRNKRDNIYNICVFNENAQKIVSALYYPGAIALDRKMKKANDIISWVRSPNQKKRKIPFKKWSENEIKILISNDIISCLKLLDRTENSIRVKKQRLKQLLL